MRIAILGPSENARSYTTKRFFDEAGKADLNPVFIPLIDVELSVKDRLDATFEGRSMAQFDYILPRIDSKRVGVGYPVMRFLDHLGVNKPYPAETVLIAHNKFITLERLVAKGVRVPETYMTGSKASAKRMIDSQRMPLMLKLLSGFGGQGVMMMENKDAAKTVIDAMSTLKQEVLIERYLPNPGEDIRGIVAGDEVIAGFKRVAAEGESRANIKAGGRGTLFKLTDEMVEICLKSAEAIKSRICAVDMIQSQGKVYVIEVNINPGVQGIEKATDLNVSKRIIDFVKSEIKR